MDDTAFAEALDVEIRRRIVTAGKAQREGQIFLEEIIRTLQAYLGYRPTHIARAPKSLSRMFERAMEIHNVDNTLSPTQVVGRINDIAGSRIIVIGLVDLTSSSDMLLSQFVASAKMVLSAPVSVYVDVPKSYGWRGITVPAELTLSDGVRFPYELQLVTHLQHVWDQMEHVLYYLGRRGRSDSLESHFDSIGAEAELRELSDNLYALDKKVDEVKWKLFTGRWNAPG